MKKRDKKILFNNRLRIVKRHLPTFYGVLYQGLYPKDDLSRVHNVVGHGIVDDCVLLKLITVAKKYRKTFGKVRQRKLESAA